MLKTLVAGGGKLIDTAPTDGTTESVVGDLLAATRLNVGVFLRQRGRDRGDPGNSNAEHVADNLGAGRGRLPDAAQRQRMVAFFEALH